MEEKIIIWLQAHSSKFLDVFLQAESYVASWIGALCVFIVIILFVNKKYGLFFGAGFLASIGVNYCIKEIVARPRPYVANPEIVNKLTTIGKSFPSGHSVSVIFMVLSVLFLFHILNKNGKFKLFSKPWFKVLCYVLGIAFVVLTAISRMYLGQHYLSDILAGLALGSIGFVVTAILYKKLVVNKQKQWYNFLVNL